MSALTRRIPRPSAALVVAIVALFMALGGTSYAALKITGKNVENSTLTGADVKNKSLAEKELEPDTLTGSRINEATLGTVPSATTAAKAADADTLGGHPATDFMLDMPRAYESNIPTAYNFAAGTPRGTLTDLPAGEYVVTARLSYHNPGAAGQETCTLEVPGADDRATFTVGAGESEAISMQEVVNSESLFMLTVNCTSDGSDDIRGESIIALRVD